MLKVSKVTTSGVHTDDMLTPTLTCSSPGREGAPTWVYREGYREDVYPPGYLLEYMGPSLLASLGAI